ncbi:hypothetical protein PR048_001556 [Dryococelus australis]|uniref:Calmodulin-lysine N-methyltransferase n=1 Tax=Dryococelus australis TaxID=614101 RepID=A0ABQ9IK53_9NEOP|nr:hypothetical protein PR048_001556 [Dryococelus australis]
MSLGCNGYQSICRVERKQSQYQRSSEPCASRNEMARRRWKILAHALQKSSDIDDSISSVQRFTYELVISKPLPFKSQLCFGDPLASWYEYCATIGCESFSVYVRHPSRNFTAVELMGFNNTGNICIWPSEEVLSFYVLCNLHKFAGKSVLELGGGMTCLAGLMVAKYSSAARIHLTDGNRLAVDNLKHVVERNGFACTDRVTHSVLQWNDIRKMPSDKQMPMYDIILSADCLFFDEVRLDLVETIWSSLKDNGVALVMAPRRGNTFEKFAEAANLRGFICTKKLQYNDMVWSRHVKMKQTCDYNEDIHYPLLLVLTKNYANLLFH